MRYFYKTVRRRTLMYSLPGSSMILSTVIKLLQLAGDVESSSWWIDIGGVLYNWRQCGYEWGIDIDTSYIMYGWMDGCMDVWENWSEELNVRSVRERGTGIEKQGEHVPTCIFQHQVNVSLAVCVCVGARSFSVTATRTALLTRAREDTLTTLRENRPSTILLDTPHTHTHNAGDPLHPVCSVGKTYTKKLMWGAFIIVLMREGTQT